MLLSVKLAVYMSIYMNKHYCTTMVQALHGYGTMVEQTQECSGGGVRHPGARPTERGLTVDEEMIPRHAAGQTDPPAQVPPNSGVHCCYSGWVFIGVMDDDGEERTAAYRCKNGPPRIVAKSVRLRGQNDA
jgi:hypothetical protein